MIRLRFITTMLCMCSLASVLAQSPVELVTAVRQKQATLKVVDYTVVRTDTLVNGFRQMTGYVEMQQIPADTVFGFLFLSRLNGEHKELMYDGQAGYEIDHTAKNYKIITSDLKQLPFLNYAGYGIMEDLMKLDTTKAIRMEITQDDRLYYLTMHYPDLIEHYVINRYKTVGIDKKTMLPVSVRKHQYSDNIGRSQDLFWSIQSIQFKDRPSDALRKPTFINTYVKKAVKTRGGSKPPMPLTNNPAPAFVLAAMDNTTVSSEDFKGKVTLLDFWEIWCGACIESMPKVEGLYKKYAGKGLQVYSILMDPTQQETAKRLISKTGISFPTLLGNTLLRESYPFSAVPLYVLIDKQGIVRFIQYGYSPMMEEAIQALVAQ